MPFVAIGQGLAIATITGLISKGVSEQKQGVALGINGSIPVSYTHLRAHETVLDLVCRLLLEKKKKQK